jgi:hypothetical protein
MHKATLPVIPKVAELMLLAGLTSLSCTQVHTEASYDDRGHTEASCDDRGHTVRPIVISSIRSLFFFFLFLFVSLPFCIFLYFSFLFAAFLL